MHIKNKLFCSNSINPEPKRKPKHNTLNKDKDTASHKPALLRWGGGGGWLVQDTRQMMFFFVSNSLNAGNVDKQYNRL